MKVLMLITSILLLGACAITPVVPPTVKSVSGTYQGMKYGRTYISAGNDRTPDLLEVHQVVQQVKEFVAAKAVGQARRHH